MIRLLLVLIFSAAAVFAQAQPLTPDCGPWYFPTSTAGSSTVVLNGAGDNRNLGCTTWTVRYASTGFSGLTVTFQSAPGSTAIGAWGAFAGTTVTGSNPMTNTVGAESTFSNPTTGAISFVRITVSGLTGSGTINAMFYGYRTGPSGGGGGGGSGCSDPCVVIGPDAPGDAPTEPPVQAGGQGLSGTVTRIQTDDSGIAGAAIKADEETQNDGVLNDVNTPHGIDDLEIYFPILPYIFNGSTWARQFSCSSTASVSSAAGTNQIVALTAGQTIRVCNLTVGFDAGGVGDMSLVYGTGVNCGTGTTTIAGPYDQITAFGPTFSQAAPLTIPAGNALCVATNGGAPTLTGVVIYAKF